MKSFDFLLNPAVEKEVKDVVSKWLKDAIESYKKEHSIDYSKPPTKEEIKLHLKLPNCEKISKFKELIWQLEPVSGSGIQSWRKVLLPEEEMLPDWMPPTPPKVDLSLQLAIKKFRDEKPKPQRSIE